MARPSVKDGQRKTPTKERQKRSRGLTGGTYAELRELIFSGQLRPSDRLVETEVAARLNVSRTPIREALQKLRADGLVVDAPRGGYEVADLSPEYIVDHYAVREVLEGLAARLAATAATELEILQLAVELDAMKGANKANNIDELATRNANFYLLIAKASHNVALIEVLGLLQNRLRMLRDFNLRVASRRAEALKEQQLLMDAIAARDPNASEQAAKALVANARQARLNSLRGLR
jgi:DNA-binding GntR family transcriptional regulator